MDIIDRCGSCDQMRAHDRAELNELGLWGGCSCTWASAPCIPFVFAHVLLMKKGVHWLYFLPPPSTPAHLLALTLCALLHNSVILMHSICTLVNLFSLKSIFILSTVRLSADIVIHIFGNHALLFFPFTVVHLIAGQILKPHMGTSKNRTEL